ncbi:MAG: T9SS type A sorting domain-containing protein [Candidatus Eisenbacteria bacterium]|uniref:T9SS type A sorting domain-containing protein n=1 Tax=Eiseniibacteriota bacterium TaxID=2212470 RepID=A0A538U3E5_UNCEI|nr:MAG: T9SS type A sorting domain-containing protein [Candidatus Eisenbacteria bacterium]
MLRLAALALAVVATPVAARPAFDLSATSRPSPTVVATLARLAGDPALSRIGTPAHVDERYGVPSFVWATRAPGIRPRAQVRPSSEQAARGFLTQLAPYYRLDQGDVQGATLRYVHDIGRGPIIVSLKQTIGGVEVFRDEVKVVMDRNLDLVAVSGYIPGKAEAGRAEARAFRGTDLEAVGRALDDFIGAPLDRALMRRAGPAPGGYQRLTLAPGAARPVALAEAEPIRSKPVLFHLPDRLVPAYYLEVMTPTEAVAYVVSDADGSILFRQDLMANDAYSYRVWADGTTLHAPFDGPQGDSPSPHPTGIPDNFDPPFVAPALLTLQNGPISTNDPWLPPGTSVTNGNNVDAYADLVSPDGLTAGDFRASTTAANTFDRTYDTAQPPYLNTTQQMAAITQLFYDNNFLHDWYYDSGFNEAAGNAQTSNYGRGGIEGDNIRAEAEDYSGTNNANMSTPADGGRPRMQMYVFNPLTRVRVNSPAGIAGDKSAGTATFGPQSFLVTADVVVVNDGVGTPSDGCEAIVNAVAGKIALVDRSSCAFTAQVLNAQAAGAVGVIVANTTSGTVTMTGTGAITIPTLMVSLADGNTIKNSLLSGAVNVTLLRALARDGTIDNQIVAHEWMHYVSNRLVGNASGLSNQQGGGMGEGWSDFSALLLTVKPEDATVPSNPNFAGVYAMGSYALQNSVTPTNAYYFGVRRYPYSTDFNKNPLTFRHIQNGTALPVGPPVAFGASGTNNAEVHNTGEVWCNMLWECYASLIRDSGRLTFDQARDRMRDYIIAGLEATPDAPTILEARDALLAAAYASDPADFGLMCGAFARRGAGVGAIGPDRTSTTNVGVTESYVCGGDLTFVSAALNDDAHSCDADGYLDEGEIGHLTVTLKNTGNSTLTATTGSVSSTNPSVVFWGSNTLTFPASNPFGTTTASVYVTSSGAAGIQVQDFQIQYNDPGLVVPGPRNAAYSTRGNVDEVPSVNESVEARVPPWTMSAAVPATGQPWVRQEVTPTSHRFHGPDPGEISDQSLISPALVVGGGPFSFTFQHAYSFETSGGTFWDGGVIEISDNGGASWTDIGASVSPGYGGTITTISGNPLGGRSGFVGASPGYPGLGLATVNLGTTYAGKTVMVRFRIGSDEAVSDGGWFIDDLQFTGLLNQPFLSVVVDPGPCTPVAADEPSLPAQLSFAISGANPASARADFRFALPQQARVRITIHDVSGRLVATIADGDFPAGYHDAAWGGPAGEARPSSGVYFVRMTANDRQITRRLVMLPR